MCILLTTEFLCLHNILWSLNRSLKNARYISSCSCPCANLFNLIRHSQVIYLVMARNQAPYSQLRRINCTINGLQIFGSFDLFSLLFIGSNIQIVRPWVHFGPKTFAFSFFTAIKPSSSRMKPSLSAHLACTWVWLLWSHPNEPHKPGFDSNGLTLCMLKHPKWHNKRRCEEKNFTYYGQCSHCQQP